MIPLQNSYVEIIRKLNMLSTCRKLYPSAIESCTTLLPQVELARDIKRFASQRISTQIESIDNSTTNENVVNLSARIRTASGSRAAAKLREAGRVPGTLFSLGGVSTEDKILLSFDKKEISSVYQKVGSYGWGCQVCNVIIESDADDADSCRSIRALGRQLHTTAATAEAENVTLIGFPNDRTVKVDVPLKTFGKEVSPGIRAGGRVNWIRRTIPCLVEGSASVPQFFEVDISDLEVNDKVLWTSLELPVGVKILLKDPRQPLLKMARK